LGRVSRIINGFHNGDKTKPTVQFQGSSKFIVNAAEIEKRVPFAELETESDAARISRFNAQLDAYDKRQLPESISIGYVGTLDSRGDDRSWRLFKKRPGQTAVSFGDFSTAERYKLLPLIRAITFATKA